MLFQAVVDDCAMQLEAATAAGADIDDMQDELADAKTELALLVDSHEPQSLQDTSDTPAEELHPKFAATEPHTNAILKKSRGEAASVGEGPEAQLPNEPAQLPSTSSAGSNHFL